MRTLIVILALPLLLAGCLSFNSSPAPRETVVVPSTTTTTVICAGGMQPPC
jgi:PBP1b-binding outer membrane lipoprotein LpoB